MQKMQGATFCQLLHQTSFDKRNSFTRRPPRTVDVSIMQDAMIDLSHGKDACFACT